MGGVRLSDGSTIPYGTWKDRIHNAKAIVYGRTAVKLGDMSHVMSVDYCKGYGMAELAYDPDNIKMLPRQQHMDWEAKNIEKCLENPYFAESIRYIADNDKAGVCWGQWVLKLEAYLEENGEHPLITKLLEYGAREDTD